MGKGTRIRGRRDSTGNVFIRKPATSGMENKKGVVLQAHIDMVPQKNEDTVHDFTKILSVLISTVIGYGPRHDPRF